MSKQIDQLLKIKRLVESENSGEATAAQAFLCRLMAKHNVSYQDLEQQVKVWRSIRYKDKYQRMIAIGCIVSTLGTNECEHYFDKSRIHFEVSMSDAVEILEKFDFYARRFSEDLDTMLGAFIQKNRLTYTPKSGDDTHAYDQIELDKILDMMSILKQHTLYKAIGQGG